MTKLSPSRVIVVAGFAAIMAIGFCAESAAGQRRHSTTHASICGNPKVPCQTSVTFPPNDLPFRVPKKAVIVDTQPFYAIILKNMAGENAGCDVFIPESERLAAQKLFPDHKVFSSRCDDPENLFYLDLKPPKTTNISVDHRIMAVYAGTTLAEANRMLAAVKATGKFPGAKLRRMRTGFNGT